MRRASFMRWGLVPNWAKDVTIGARMINARAETAAEKPAFKELLQRRRCLIPADGFCEWQKSGKSKQFYCFEMLQRETIALAGLASAGRSRPRDLHNTHNDAQSAPGPMRQLAAVACTPSQFFLAMETDAPEKIV